MKNKSTHRLLIIATLFISCLFFSFFNDVKKPQFDPDAQRYFNACTPKPSTKFMLAVNNFFVYLKTTGEFYKYDYGLLIAAEYQQNALINIFNPTFTATPVNSPTFVASSHFVGNGTTQYIDLNYSPNLHGSNFIKSNNGITIYTTEDVTAGSAETGNYNGVTGNWVATEWTDNKQYARTAATSAGATNNSSAGLNSYLYNGTTIYQYMNGSQIGTTAVTTATLPTLNEWLLGLNNNGSLYLGSTKKIRFVFYHKGDADLKILYKGLQRFMADISSDVATAYGFGDSFMYGTNASTQDSSWFNRMCAYKGWVCVNKGVSGEAITPGGPQNWFDVSNIVPKENIGDKIIVDWTLNDAVMIYSVTPTRNPKQFIYSLSNFLGTALNNTNHYYPSDIIGITGWAVGTNTYYTQDQINTISAKTDSVFSAYGVQCVKNFTYYPRAGDSIHIKDDASYRNVWNQIKTKLSY